MTLRRRLRDPVLHFLVLGTLLFFARDLVPQSAEPIRVRGADIEQLRQAWQRETGRAPTPEQLRVSIERWLEDEALLREAVRRGLDQSDAVARRRLLMNLRFAHTGSPMDDGTLLKVATALEMQRSDLVVRRRLIQAMEQRLVEEIPWTGEALDAYVAAHPQRYAGEVRYTFRHAYLAPSRGPEEATRMLASLRAQPAPASLPGDPFLLGERFEAQTAAQIAQRFGEPLAQALVTASAGEWIGPLVSPYGQHLLQLERRDDAPSGPVVSRRAAAYAFIADRETQRLATARAELRKRYRIDADADVADQVPL